MKRIPTFVAGMLTTALIGGLGISALAATGQLTITVDPINIQVNGVTFQPKDAQGNDVPVFAYNGTTYAPLRALAEAYSLEVGYDAGANMATVTGDVAAPANTTTPAPDTTASVADYSDWTAEEEAAYQEFKGMWEVIKTDKGDVKYGAAANVIGGPWESYALNTTSSMAQGDLVDFILAAGKTGFTTRLAKELSSSNVSIEIYFYKDGWYITGFLQEAN